MKKRTTNQNNHPDIAGEQLLCPSLFVFSLAPFTKNSSLSNSYSYQWTISLCSMPSLWLFSLYPRGFVATRQLCKTNPIRQTMESVQHHSPQALTTILRPAPLEKTNPIKPNFKIGKMTISTVATKPHPNDQSTTNVTQNKPNSPKPGIGATSFKTRTYENDAIRPARKNKAKQSQFIPAKPCAKTEQSQFIPAKPSRYSMVFMFAPRDCISIANSGKVTLMASAVSMVDWPSRASPAMA